MIRRALPLGVVLGLALAVAAPPVPGSAAGEPGMLSADPAVAVAESGNARMVRGYLDRFAVLAAVRTKFDLLTRAEADWLVAAEHLRLGGMGPTEADQVALDRALLAEGSYYLVSLRYLIDAGGAVWPADRSEHLYEIEALKILEALQDRLFEVVAARTDPLPVFTEAQRIWAWTEGYYGVPAELDVFGRRDEVVRAAMAMQSEFRADT